MPTCRVLIVDDDAEFREVLSLALGRAGIESVSVSDGQKALDWLRDNPAPTVILLDLQMPVMDGRVFQQQAQAKGFDIPTIVMSGAMDPRQYADELGANGYVTKPFNVNDLFKQIGQLAGAGERGTS